MISQSEFLEKIIGSLLYQIEPVAINLAKEGLLKGLMICQKDQ